MENAMSSLKYYAFRKAMVLILIVNLSKVCAEVDVLAPHSFVYNYGHAKIWVFIETNTTLTISPRTNSTILLTAYLENLEDNKGIFLNRVTFMLRQTQLEKSVSPNVTLDNSQRSWSYNATFEFEDISTILRPGQSLNGEMSFEFRYDIIDSSGDVWSFRVNEDFPVEFANAGQLEQPWVSFQMVFVIVLIFAIVSAIVLSWLKIRKYKKQYELTHAEKQSQ